MNSETNQFLAKDHAQLSAQLAIYEIEASASEVHGIACGLICSNTAMSTNLWSRLIRDPSDTNGDTNGDTDEEVDDDDGGNVDHGLPSALDRNLGSLMETLRLQLNSPDFEFAVMIPTDDHPADERLEALAQWCQGFSLGFFAENQREIQTLPGDAGEILRDIIEIAGANPEIDGDDLDEADRFLTEIEEYLRVSVQLIFEEIQDEADAAAKPSSPGPGPDTDHDPIIH